ncbi:hypothetical protein Hypma_013762 [Hypsizygus marmoreus]|uniref:Uncharacterized protein n=1 Tax=Hypsizygus marmoreus TaxID=39966 RepID=A0A369KDF0_HYPMA|nr:hypothetical protein Hypma_013762 [Hypsizygus marmoreus]
MGKRKAARWNSTIYADSSDEEDDLLPQESRTSFHAHTISVASVSHEKETRTASIATRASPEKKARREAPNLIDDCSPLEHSDRTDIFDAFQDIGPEPSWDEEDGSPAKKRTQTASVNNSYFVFHELHD